MHRSLIEDLKAWKDATKRKPLIMQGARQVGKTFLIKEFAQQHYTSLVYINFEVEQNMRALFEQSLDPNLILDKIRLIKEVVIEEKTTLIFFDEIQACPKALTSLKYFNEMAPEYHVVAAGSLLGVSFSQTNHEHSFPVGKVTFMNLYPMSFLEYLQAVGQSPLGKTLQESPEIIDHTLHTILMDHLKTFVLIGGMPEAVQTYIDTKDINKVRRVQYDINAAYEHDFIKYADPSQAIKNKEVWQSIPYQLGKENKKFTYKEVKKNARASHYELALNWLQAAGLIYKVNQVRTTLLPLQAYEDDSKFKIFPLDTGLLSAILQINTTLILDDVGLFSSFKGALTECFVCSELVKYFNTTPHYWASHNQAEVDFLIQSKNHIIPLEVKSGMDRHTKSLRSYQNLNKATYVFRASPRKYSKSEDGFINIGLYSVMGLGSFTQKLF